MEGIMEQLKQVLLYLEDLNLISITVRLVLSVCFAGIIGIERGRKRRPAGFRTYVMVCVGSTLTMMISQYAVLQGFVVGDATRLGAQVINGIGFLGAGTIIVTARQQVRGLTTAAGLWASACMGLAIGAGFYTGAIVTFLMILLVSTLLNRLNTYIMSTARSMNLYVEYEDSATVSHIINLIRDNHAQVTDMHLAKAQTADGIFSSAVLTIDAQKALHHNALISEIAAVRNVRHVEEL